MFNVLIYGCRKTGSTLTQRLLELDGYTFFPVETKLKSFKKFLKNKNNIDLDQLRNHFPIKYISEFKINESEYNQFLIDHYKKIQNVNDFINLHVGALEKSRNKFNKNFIIKEISGDTKVLLDEYLKNINSPKIIFINRNPKFITKAVFTDRKRRKIKISLKKKILETIEPQIILSLIGNYKQNENVYILNYEELISNTEAEIKKICNFLNIEYLKKYSIPTLNGTETIVDTSSKKEFKVFDSKKSLIKGISFVEYTLIKFSKIFYYIYMLFYKLKILNIFIKNKEFIKTLD